ncbi:MAG TPA: amidohydrolase family protein [Methylomirabilota bacterium]|nr:amidohydrolase family protein [Methylomirabilota bacterium]
MSVRRILRGASIVDGTGAPPVRDRAVVLEAGRIAAVVDDAHARDGEVLDLGGLTLLPGLINCHTHLALSGAADPARVLLDEPYAMTVIQATLRARRTVEAGVTTIRDLGGRDYAEVAVRNAVAGGLIPGPRILAAGRGICMTGGHGWQLLARQADGADEVRKAVREQLRAGADVIKLLATGGVMTPGVDPRAAQLTLAELTAGVEEAHKARRKAAAHAQAEEGIALCLQAGIDTIEHGIFLTEALAARMAAAGTALVATLVAPHAIVEGGIAAGIPEFAVKKSATVRERHLESFRLAMRAGVLIAAGTDAGTPLNPHGTIVPELMLMAGAGMAPLDVITAATSVAAHVAGLAAETGRVAPGLAADLLAVEGNPAESLKALDDVRLVIADGRIVVNRL